MTKLKGQRNETEICDLKGPTLCFNWTENLA